MPGRKRSKATVTTVGGALAVVTGAGSGIGRATALGLAAGGARVICADIDLASAERTALECTALERAARAPGAAALAVDVADWTAVQLLAKTVESDHGVPDIVVNNAGVGMSARLLDAPVEDWEWIVGINLMGVVHGCRAFGPAMVERGSGHVVNVSSGLAYIPTATEIAYGTTKAGVLALSRALRADWSAYGVGVTAVCPGVIDTPIVTTTRYRGEQADPERVARVRQAFARRGHAPALVADAIIDAVGRNRSVVPVGLEAKIGWHASRLLPIRVVDRLARMELGR